MEANRIIQAFRAVSLLAALPLAGCGLIEDVTSLPVKAVTSVMPGSRTQPLDPAMLQIEIQRYADEYASRTVGAIEEYAQLAGTDEAMSNSLRWKLNMTTSVFAIASGPNPVANLLDFLSIATLTRALIEDHWIKTEGGKAFEPWLETSRTLEKEAWNLAKNVVTAEQELELRACLYRWMQAHPTARTAFFARPQEIATVVRHTADSKKTPGGLISLVGLDPMSGLDPAVREVTRTRLFAERALFAMQRVPFLVRGQIEYLADRLYAGPAGIKTLGLAERVTESAERITKTAETVGQTAAQLPDRLAAERQAILTALEAQEGKLRELSAEVGRTLAAGEKMSASLQPTIVSFEALMKRFGVGEPKPQGASPPNPDAKPFNILDFAHTAEKLTVMARELEVLIKSLGTTLDSPALDQRLEAVSATAERAAGDVKSLLNHAALIGAGLIVLAFTCALAYRRLAPRAARSDSYAER